MLDYLKFPNSTLAFKNGEYSRQAAREGNFEAIKWAKTRNDTLHSFIAGDAAKGGSIPMLEWICQETHSENPNQFWHNVWIVFGAASSGHLHLLTFLFETKKCPINYAVSEYATTGGHLQILKWLDVKKIKMSDRLLYLAAEGGHLEILSWLHFEKGYMLHEGIFSSATLSGNLDVLKWLYNCKCPWNGLTCENAAALGHLHILKWLRKHNCPWNGKTCAIAKKNQHMDVFNWAIQNKCPYNETTDIIRELSRRAH